MDAIGTLRALRRSGYVVTVERERLRLRGHAKPSEDLYASVVRHRDELIRLVEEDIIVDEREVFGMAREFFGKGQRGAA